MAGTVCEVSSSIESTPRPARQGAVTRRVRALVAGGVLAAAGVVSLPGVSAAQAPADGPRPAACKASYTVRAGDGWTMIAARLGVKATELYALNGATWRTPIYPGRAICVPAGAVVAAPVPSTVPNAPASASCARPYTVRPGDAWTTIAARHKVRVDALYSLNGSTARTVLFAGRTVCLPTNASTPAAAPPTATAPPAAAPPTTRPPATVTPSKQNWSQDEVIAIIRQVWPDELEEKAIAIAWRESKHRPGVRNYCCFGVFQIYWNVHKGWLSSIGVTAAEQLYNPLVNAQAALMLYNRAGGWGPWRTTAG